MNIPISLSCFIDSSLLAIRLRRPKPAHTTADQTHKRARRGYAVARLRMGVHRRYGKTDIMSGRRAEATAMPMKASHSVCAPHQAPNRVSLASPARLNVWAPAHHSSFHSFSTPGLQQSRYSSLHSIATCLSQSSCTASAAPPAINTRQVTGSSGCGVGGKEGRPFFGKFANFQPLAPPPN